MTGHLDADAGKVKKRQTAFVFLSLEGVMGNGETKLDPPRLSPLSQRRGSGRPLVNWTILEEDS